MRDQKMEKNLPIADGMGSIGIQRVIAAILAKTRQEWNLPGPASASTAVPFVDRSRLVRPYFRPVSDARNYTIANSRGRLTKVSIKRGNILESQE